MLSLLRSFSRPALQRARPWGALRTHAKPLGRSTFADFASAHPEQKQYKAKKDSLLSPTMLLVGIIPFFTFALGTWQVQRLQWKVNLIDEVREKMEREPITLPKRINLSVIPEFAYRKVLLKGTWDETRSILVGPRVRDGTAGYHLVTPLVRDDGSTVLVDRGFVSRDLAEQARAARGGERGEVQVLGMLRTSQVRNTFTPDNQPEKGEWYWVDVNAMAEQAGGEKAGVQPVFVEAIFEGHAGEVSSKIARGLPVGRAPGVDLPNSHLSYAVTWYSLSVFTGFMFARLMMKQRRAHGRMPR